MCITDMAVKSILSKYGAMSDGIKLFGTLKTQLQFPILYIFESVFEEAHNCFSDSLSL